MKKYINLLLGLVFVLSVNLYLRTFTINFPQLKDQARQIVEQHIQDIATATVKKTYPDYSVLTQDKLAENFALQFKNKNQKTLKKQIQEEYAQLRSRYQDASGQTYLLEMDCWNWARYTQNILLFGHPGDKLMRGYNLDNLMLAPSGGIIMWNQFLFWLSAFIYRIFCLFHPVALFAFLFYLPLFYTAIFLVLLYLVISRYWGNLAAVIACLYVGLAPDFLLHSFAG
ncbi:MAG: hypothetical protein NT033_09760, partial [Candidatus Omnitrophica bacterium]|nr:hypothetical protein [Candidatus Omnitrophota bacterium]